MATPPLPPKKRKKMRKRPAEAGGNDIKDGVEELGAVIGRTYTCFRLAYFYFLLQALWVLGLTAAAIAKIATDGFHSYVSHFTNWSWTLQIVFYGATLIYPFWLRGGVAVIQLLFFLLSGVVW